MTDQPATRLETAHAAMTAAPLDDAARLRYFAALADGMLFLMLEEEAKDGTLRPRVFELEDGPVVLAYDLEERLAEAAGGATPYAELPGRVIAAQLAGQGVSLGVNLGVAESAYLMPPDALEWLSSTLAHNPDELAARPVAFEPARGLPQALIEALDGKLARAAGLASAALLAAVRYEDGRNGHMLAFLDAKPGAETALARAANEALTFSGIEAGEMDVSFLEAQSAVAQKMARVALRIDLPQPTAPEEPRSTPKAPGMDPQKPPKLR
jgi:hypothetical protein